jgi:hypothetical protein
MANDGRMTTEERRRIWRAMGINPAFPRSDGGDGGEGDGGNEGDEEGGRGSEERSGGQLHNVDHVPMPFPLGTSTVQAVRAGLGDGEEEEEAAASRAPPVVDQATPPFRPCTLMPSLQVVYAPAPHFVHRER